jgi:hypothetical protein
MAKKRTVTREGLADAIAPTSKKDLPKKQLDPDKPKASGISLTPAEWDRLDNIAQENGVSRSNVARFAILYFLQELDAGNVELEFRVTRRELILPE